MDATHRHKKRGTEYVLIGVGRLQAEKWSDLTTRNSVDMRKVAIYRSVDDGSLWVRPVEEFSDGRFEAIAASEVVTSSDCFEDQPPQSKAITMGVTDWLSWDPRRGIAPPVGNVQVRFRNGNTSAPANAFEFRWAHSGGPSDIVAWR